MQHNVARALVVDGARERERECLLVPAAGVAAGSAGYGSCACHLCLLFLLGPGERGVLHAWGSWVACMATVRGAG